MNKVDFSIVSAFSHKVKQIRKEKQLSQAALADMAKVSRTTISHIEREKPLYVPSFTNVYKIATVLGISLDNLLK